MIDETCGQLDPKQQLKVGVRTRVMDSLQLNVLGFIPKSPAQRMSTLGSILRCVMSGVISTKKRKIMNVDELVEAWVKAVVGMCHAHDKDGFDTADAQADKLLSPLLAAPVAQIREFYFKLVERMKADEKVPFLVKIAFEAWGEAVVKNAPDEGVKRLKRKLAQDIVELVEAPIASQMPEAIKRALMWRDPETLKEIKEALEDGAKPKLVGRQSCLFIEAKTKARKGKPSKKVSVMV